MSNKKIPKILLIVIGIAAISVLAAFSAFRGRFPQSQNATGKTQEHFAESQSSWDAAFTESFEKKAPDFSVEDINGKTHKLSDYLGRNMVVVFWATWCPACNLEIPHLIELRKTFTEDKLAILAISNEEPERLKQFAEAKGINYTIASLGDSRLPKPFTDVTAIPTTFFIDPEGNIKFAALGVVPLSKAKEIINTR